MNIVSETFTKEQYKALYEAQQLGVRFDCYLLPPGVRIDGLTVIDERTHRPVYTYSVPTLSANDLIIRAPNYNHDVLLDQIVVVAHNKKLSASIDDHNNNK